MEEADAETDDEETFLRRMVRELEPLAILALGFAPSVAVSWVLDQARSAGSPDSTFTGFSGFESNPTAGLPGAKNGDTDAFIVLATTPPTVPTTINVPPLPPPNALTVIGDFWIPFEFISLVDDGVLVSANIQGDLNGHFEYFYQPSPVISGTHTLVAVGNTTGHRFSQQYIATSRRVIT